MTDSLREEVVRMHAQVCSGLADPNRILIIYSLAEGPRNVTDIASAVEPRSLQYRDISRSCVNEVSFVLSEMGKQLTIILATCASYRPLTCCVPPLRTSCASKCFWHAR
jgi:DNA-binding transcriptional ArsR family regulator